MSEYSSLKATINANIKANNNQEITGSVMNSVLNAMVNTLGAGYQFAGVATTATNPGTPDAKVFYIANGKGTYTNFGSLEVTEDEVVVLYWDTAWHKEATGIASQEKLTELESEVTGLNIASISGLSYLEDAGIQVIPNSAEVAAELIENGFLDNKGNVIQNGSYHIYKVIPTSTFYIFKTKVRYGEILPVVCAYDGSGKFISSLVYASGKGTEDIDSAFFVPQNTAYILFVTFLSNNFSIFSCNYTPIIEENEISNIVYSAFSSFKSKVGECYIYQENAYLNSGRIIENENYDIYRVDLSPDVFGYTIKNISVKFGSEVYSAALYNSNFECIKLLCSQITKTGKKTVSFSFENTADASILLFTKFKLNSTETPLVLEYAEPFIDSKEMLFSMNGYISNQAAGYRFVESDEWRCTPIITIDKGVFVSVIANNYYVSHVILYDKNFNVISAEVNSGIINRWYTQKDAYYIRISTELSKIDNTIVRILSESESLLFNKTVAFLGDSITAQGYVTKTLSANRGCNILNYGVGGSTLSSQGNPYHPELDNFVTRFDNVITPAITSGQNVDYFIMWGGINDFVAKNTLGDISQANRQATFYASLHYLAQKQREILGNTPILWITPMHDNYSQGTSDHYDWKIENGVFSFNNNDNAYLYEFVNAIKEVASVYGIKVLDLYSLAPAPQVRSDLFLDRLHPNEKGGAFLAEYIYKAICCCVL